MVSSAAVQGWRANVREFAMTSFKHPAWGASHAARDYSLALKLAAADKVKLDDDVLYAAAWLHDMGAFAPWADPKADHAEVALSSAAKMLAGAGFPAAKQEAVRGAMRTHMYERTPEGPEALYLHDADALEWLGAIGAARLLALADPNGAAPTLPMMAAGLEDVLAKVPARVLSPAGRALLPARKAELEQFLKELRAESDNFTQL
ncbi:MAG: metal-dependent phosphohydrolase [Elusimicrobia bacterium]|nr:metal-dependent phosphohydrolase [Elusimicrobiota bacterium]